MSPAIEASECLTQQLAYTDVLLTKSYKALLKRVPVNDPNPQGQKEVADLLKRSQSSWIRYRDSHCGYVGYLQGGVASYKAVDTLACKLTITKDRLQELQVLGAGYE